MGGGRFIISLSRFDLIPGSPIAYWVSDKLIQAFVNGKFLSSIATPRQGLATGDNNRFLRFWYEVDIDDIFFTATDYINAFATGAKWFPYNKGGEFKKWYGNNDYIVNWQNNGKEIRNFTNDSGKIASRAQNTQFYFRRSITWSKISGGNIAFRYKPKGHIFDVAGTSIFTENDKDRFYILGLLNTEVIQHILTATSPTLNYEVGQIANLPIIMADKQDVNEIVEQNISLSQADWDSFETSWDFKKHPLI